MVKLITGHIKETNENFFFPKEEASIKEQVLPETIPKMIKEDVEGLIRDESGIRSGLSGYSRGFGFFKFVVTDFDYYKFMSFCAVYYEKLKENMYKNRGDYMGSPESTYKNMKPAIADMSFNKDSPSFKKTCKELGIKHTYKAIKAYMKGET